MIPSRHYECVQQSLKSIQLTTCSSKESTEFLWELESNPSTFVPCSVSKHGCFYSGAITLSSPELYELHEQPEQSLSSPEHYPYHNMFFFSRDLAGFSETRLGLRITQGKLTRIVSRLGKSS